MKVLGRLSIALSLIALPVSLASCASDGSEDMEEEVEVTEEDSQDAAEIEDEADTEEDVASEESDSESVADEGDEGASSEELAAAIEELDAEGSTETPSFLGLKPSPEGAADLGSTPVDASQRVATVKSYALAVRSGASATSPILRHLEHGTQVSVQSVEGPYAQIGAGEYVRVGFLKLDDAPIGDGEQAFQVVSRALYIRSNPGSAAPIVGVLLEGETVKVVSQNGAWADLGQGRYVNTSFLRSVAH